MGFDIRMPIGALFSVLGLLLSIYGAITGGSEIYALHGNAESYPLTRNALGRQQKLGERRVDRAAVETGWVLPA